MIHRSRLPAKRNQLVKAGAKRGTFPPETRKVAAINYIYRRDMLGTPVSVEFKQNRMTNLSQNSVTNIRNTKKQR